MAAILRPEWEVTSVGNGADALDRVAGSDFDMALIDITLPGMDGFGLLGRLAQASPQTIRVIVSGREDVTARMRARSGGASAYVSKNLPPDRMAAILDEVLDGAIHFDDGTSSRTEPTPVGTLTARQTQVLEMLALGHSNKEIERALKISERTVRAHITEIFAALKVQSRTQAILAAQKQGLV
jgi:DNA-binding NarL/FixJ family response regulator